MVVTSWWRPDMGVRWGLLTLGEEYPSVIGGFPSQKASYADLWWFLFNKQLCLMVIRALIAPWWTHYTIFNILVVFKNSIVDNNNAEITSYFHIIRKIYPHCCGGIQWEKCHLPKDQICYHTGYCLGYMRQFGNVFGMLNSHTLFPFTMLVPVYPQAWSVMYRPIQHIFE